MLTKVDFLEYVKTNADFMNFRYFDSQLQFSIELHRRISISWYAKFISARGVILYNPIMLGAKLSEIEEITTHELIHVAQLAFGERIGHGPSFRKIAVRHGIPVESSQSCASFNVRPIREMRPK